MLDTSLIQYLSFIAGYCVHSIFKSAFYSKLGITYRYKGKVITKALIEETTAKLQADY